MPDLIHPMALRATRAIHALKSPPPAGSQHYRSGFDDGLEAAIDAVKDAIPPSVVDVPRETSTEPRWDVLNQLPDEIDMLIYGTDHVPGSPLTWKVWQDALGHPHADGHGYCKTCGPAITCMLAAFFDALVASTVREVDKLGLLVPRETSTPDNGDTP